MDLVIRILPREVAPTVPTEVSWINPIRTEQAIKKSNDQNSQT
jgi:hypothetical protein